MTREQVEERINLLISTYDYPVEILQDVYKRLNDNRCVHYHMQQLRYLDNLVSAGYVNLKSEERLE